MSDIPELNELRLRNLKFLHGTTSEHIAPTSETFLHTLNSGGVNISQSTLSNIYLRKKLIDDLLARNIETALHVAPGWLSYDHSAWLTASAEDRVLVSSILALQTEAKHHLAKFLHQISQRD